MVDKIRALVEKWDVPIINKIWLIVEKYWDILCYLFFGGLTTIVNWAVFFPCYNLLKEQIPVDATRSLVANGIAWVMAVAFAYLTNKPFVFESHDWSAKTVIPELTKFVGCRIGSGLAETGILYIVVLLGWSGNVWKILTSVLVVILNYIASKLLVFRKK